MIMQQLIFVWSERAIVKREEEHQVGVLIMLTPIFPYADLVPLLPRRALKKGLTVDTA